MVRNFRGQVKISDVQEEFDNLVNSINANIDEYNANLETTENLDYSKGSATLGGSGYCLTVGGLKTLLNNYAGTMLGAKPFKTKNGAKTLVTAGIYIDTDGCKTNKGQLISKLGKHLYFDKASNTYTISDDAQSPSIEGYIVSDEIPYQDNNEGTYYSFDSYFIDPSSSYMILNKTRESGYPIILSEYGTNSSSSLNSMIISINKEPSNTHYYLSEGENYNTTCAFSIYIGDVRLLSQYSDSTLDINIQTDGNNVYMLSIPITNIQNAERYKDPRYPQSYCNIDIVGNENGRLITFNSESSSEISYEITTLTIEVGVSPLSGSSAGDTMPTAVPLSLFGFNISNLFVWGEISPSGVCDMNPNRTYPYIKTFHNTELVNLRTNKITTESRNLTNGNTSGGDITYDTYSPTDNKDAGIFVSYNARKSNAGNPNGALFSIAGVVSNVELGTRFTHGSSTSACYRYPKFFFLPKGVTTPFSTTAADNIVRYNKYVATISQKV